MQSPSLLRASFTVLARPSTPTPAVSHRLTHPLTSAPACASHLRASQPTSRTYSSIAARQAHRSVHKSHHNKYSHRFAGTCKHGSLWPSFKLSSVTRHLGSAAMSNGTTAPARKPVLFFDIDNCLYSRSTRVHDRMAVLIDEYFSKHLNLPCEEAKRLHGEYYTMYGLAIEGLVRHHEIDPLDYNAKVDDALPLDDIIKPNPELRKLLEDIDKDKVTMWLFTNAYVTHGRRVVKLLGVDDLFDGLTFCDYAQYPLVCKPAKEMYEKGMREAGVDKVEDCYFVDDSFLNCSKAKEFGWTVAHLVEEGLPVPKKEASQYQIKSLQELRDIFPQFFKSKNTVGA